MKSFNFDVPFDFCPSNCKFKNISVETNEFSYPDSMIDSVEIKVFCRNEEICKFWHSK